jgi:hypothetical protein
MLQEQPRLCTISISLGSEVRILEEPDRELTNIHKANPDGLYERPTIGINGQWPLPIMTATINDTVVVNVINQLGNTIFLLPDLVP